MTVAFERGVFTLSLDFELTWGSRDLVRDPSHLERMARRTREAVFDPLLAALTRHGMVATWATVGHLFLTGARRREGRLHPEVVPPTHRWLSGGWFDGVPEGDERSQPAWYARSLVERLRDAGQEVGSHSFSHPIFGDEGCSREAAATDLDAAVRAAAELGIQLESFVFPRNAPGWHELLAERDFLCWRGLEPTWYHRDGVPRPARRAGHLLDVVGAAEPPTVMPFLDEHGLWCVPASASFLPIDGVRRAIPIRRRVRRAIRGLDRAARDRRVCHLWTHPINLATDPERALAMVLEVLDHAARLRDGGRLEVWPMAEVARRAALRTPAAGARSGGSSPG